MERADKEAEFQAELTRLMEPDTHLNGKKKRRKWSRKKKIIIGLVIVAVLWLAFRSCGSKGPVGPMVSTVPLEKGHIAEELSISGPVEGTDSVDVVSNLHAEIVEMLVKEGDKVVKGQVLARLDTADLQKQVAIAQNDYDLAEAEYNRQQTLAENGYSKALQDLQDARDHLERSQTLFQNGGVSRLELDNAKTAVAECERKLREYHMADGKPIADETYRLQIEKAGFQLEQKKSDLENAEIKSPIDGTVVRVNAKVGRLADTIEDDKPIFSIENLDTLEMKLNISEYSIGRIQEGQTVVISADILNGKTVKGQISSISPTGEIKGGGSTERVVPATVSVLDKDSGLIAGITAKAKILIAEAEDVFVVPISALIENEEGAFIASVVSGTVKMIPVETGVESDISVEVSAVDGQLEEGMEIVSDPGMGLADGMAVITIG